MKLFKILIMVSILAVVGCSNSKKKKADTANSDAVQEDADFIVDAEDEELLVDDEEVAGVEESTDEALDDMAEESVASAPEIEIGDDVGQYTVSKNETLMIVAFKIYGDYRKWKDLKDLNGLSGSAIQEGMTLSYKKPLTEFSWNPEGLPYLIKGGDSLVSISQDKYSTPNKWRAIYNNNKPLIKDPNLIFAGFTIYYLPLRDLASE